MSRHVSEKSFHLAGIVPVAGQPLDFGCPWHDCLTPVAPSYLAVERAVVECAYAGCETVWIVCNDDMQPLIRYRLGDIIYDPVSLARNYSPTPGDQRRPITIFYVPIHPKDRDKRDCLSWSVLHGAVSSYHVCRTISKWVSPDRYYVAFPYGVYEPSQLRSHRAQISSKKDFFLSHLGKTVRDGEYLGFTFDFEGYKRYRDTVRKEGTGMRKPGQETELPKENLPLEERWSARFFSLDKVFGSARIEDGKTIDVDWYHSIDGWKKYCEYMGSVDSCSLERPSKHILAFRQWNPIGVNNDD
tara:strand:- start:451 stop:1350 length:900 start_codon:yes stop_codon:yes gene_type:complete